MDMISQPVLQPRGDITVLVDVQHSLERNTTVFGLMFVSIPGSDSIWSSYFRGLCISD